VTDLDARVSAALTRLINPRLDNDVLSAGMIRDLVVDQGRVAFTFLLSREDPATLVRDTRKALQAIEGVTEVKIQVVDPGGPPKTTHAAPGAPASAATGVPAPTPMAIPGLGRVVAISSGKGGVGKSTVTVNLAVALVRAGYSVGVMDADIYGPNIPRMFGIDERPRIVDQKIQPLEAHGVRLMSIGFLVDRDAPAIWRGPLKGARMFERVNVPVLGVIENMSGFTDPDTGKVWHIFATGGGDRLAEEVGVPLLGRVPLQPGIAEAADRGSPVVVELPESPAAVVLTEMAQAVAQLARSRGGSLPILQN
jgi:ATP-binding protein involved in chromosome partitioning